MNATPRLSISDSSRNILFSCPDLTSIFFSEVACPKNKGATIWLAANRGNPHLQGKTLLYSSVTDSCPKSIEIKLPNMHAVGPR